MSHEALGKHWPRVLAEVVKYSRPRASRPAGAGSHR
jgi:hypothetical protein